MPTSKNQKRGGYYVNNKTRNSKHSFSKSKYFQYIAKQQYNNYRRSFSKKNRGSRSYTSSIA